MTIDGINISTFGLIVTKFTGNFDLPKRKEVLKEPEFAAGDQTVEEKVYTVEMFGQYANQTVMATGVNGLRTLIETSLQHDFILSNRGSTFTGVVHDGFKTKVLKNNVFVTMEIGLTT